MVEVELIPSRVWERNCDKAKNPLDTVLAGPAFGITRAMAGSWIRLRRNWPWWGQRDGRPGRDFPQAPESSFAKTRALPSLRTSELRNRKAPGVEDPPNPVPSDESAKGRWRARP